MSLLVLRGSSSVGNPSRAWFLSGLYLFLLRNEEVASDEYWLSPWSLLPSAYISLMYNKDFWVDISYRSAERQLKFNLSIVQLMVAGYWQGYTFICFTRDGYFYWYFYSVQSNRSFLRLFSSSELFTSDVRSAGCSFMSEYRESACLAHAYWLLETLDLGIAEPGSSRSDMMVSRVSTKNWSTPHPFWPLNWWSEKRISDISWANTIFSKKAFLTS